LLAVIASAAAFALLMSAWLGGADTATAGRAARATMPLNPLAWPTCPAVVRSVQRHRTDAPGGSAGRSAGLPSPKAMPSMASSAPHEARTKAWPAVAAWMPVCRDL